jgi:CRP/FNR family transcriptional regulator
LPLEGQIRLGYDAKMYLRPNPIPAFSGLGEEYLALLDPLCEPYSCRAGDVVFKQGTPTDYLYLISRGRVEISFKPYDGMALTISHVGPGELCGWSAVVRSREYTSSAIAIEDLDAIRIHGSDLHKLCTEHPNAGVDILNCLADLVSSRWKDAHQQVRAIITQGMKSK